MNYEIIESVMNATRADCYSCKYRGEVPGSAHSCCKHPAFSAYLADPLASVVAILSRGAMPRPKTEVEVTGDPHGIRMGWFNHPWNFDPVWLTSCGGFTDATTGNDRQDSSKPTTPPCPPMVEQSQRLEPKDAEIERDAARYRWIRTNPAAPKTTGIWNSYLELDRAIDEAMGHAEGKR